MLKSLHHTGFVVRDLDTSAAFYSEVMGLEETSRIEAGGEFPEQILGLKGTHLKVAFLSMGDGHNLELVQYIYPPSVEVQVNLNDLGASHMAFIVENLEDYYSTMSQKGLRFIGHPPSLTRDGDVMISDASGTRPGEIGTKAIFAQDPDGNWLEFIEYPE